VLYERSNGSVKVSRTEGGKVATMALLAGSLSSKKA
jgi:hypothetical protein